MWKEKQYLVNNEQITLKEASKKTKISIHALRYRMKKRSLSLEDAMYNFENIRATIQKGDKFGYLTATGKTKKDGKYKYYEFKCLCGNLCFRKIDEIKKNRKRKKSCGKLTCHFSGKHGYTILINGKRNKEYTAWCNLRQRCNNKRNISYPYYGGIGIKVSKEFDDSFMCFLEHIGMAPTKKHTIDRIDVTKGYERNNIKWSTRKEQSNNVRKVNKLTLEIQRLRKLLKINNISF